MYIYASISCNGPLLLGSIEVWNSNIRVGFQVCLRNSRRVAYNYLSPPCLLYGTLVAQYHDETEELERMITGKWDIH